LLNKRDRCLILPRIVWIKGLQGCLAFSIPEACIYSLKEGINDSYLTPFRVKQISTTLNDYIYTANDTVVKGEIEPGRLYVRDPQDNEKTRPTVLTTPQKLATGVDARNIRNIVLMRPINKIIEFKQIIGSGTRLYDGKDHLTIYDLVKAHYHFSDPEWDGEPFEPGTPVRNAAAMRVNENDRRAKFAANILANVRNFLAHNTGSAHADGTKHLVPNVLNALAYAVELRR
jgi:hypothetical protein